MLTTTAPAVLSTDQMEAALRAVGFFVGGLTDAGIAYYYAKLFV